MEEKQVAIGGRTNGEEGGEWKRKTRGGERKSKAYDWWVPRDWWRY